jgi:integrase
LGTRAGGRAVSDVLDKFLDWTQKNKATRTYEWYRDHLQSFLNHLGPKPLPVTDLKPFHVVEWTDKHPDWSSAYHRGAIVAVQRPFNWAEELGYIPANPVKKIKKPPPQRRESHLTADGFTELLSRYPAGDPFRDLLEFAWHSGCRPQETAHIEARRMLESGANHLAVAELMGHSSGRMVAETYSHMNRANAHLKDALRKASGGA